jgi:hypothetical protein
MASADPSSSYIGHNLVTRKCDDPAMNEEEAKEDLEALNELVQSGLVEVVSIEDRVPYYRLASGLYLVKPNQCG